MSPGNLRVKIVEIHLRKVMPQKKEKHKWNKLAIETYKEDKRDAMTLLTNFSPMLHFYIPWKHQNTEGL